MAKKEQFLGTGRRKKSIARVRIMPGKGEITINKRDIEEFFGYETLKMLVRSPFVVTDTMGKYDVFVSVKGGGYTGQAGAVRHGIARALIKAEPELRGALKSAVPDARSENEGEKEIRPEGCKKSSTVLQTLIKAQIENPLTGWLAGFLFAKIVNNFIAL